MWRIRLFIEDVRCKRDIKKLARKMHYLKDEAEIEELKGLIGLREMLMSKDFYMLVNQKILSKYK